MKYNFDEQIDRRNTNALNTDGFRGYIFHAGPEKVFPYKDEEFIRMWVADMEFATAPAVCQAMKERIDRRIFGYTNVFGTDYYEALKKWCEDLYGWSFPQEELTFSSGIIPALYELAEDLLEKDETILITTPAYGFFQHTAEYNHVGLSCSPLKRVDGMFQIDFEDFERKCADEKTTAFILCNPHNPAGRVWKKEELERMNDICLKHNVKIIADEIHCELVMPGYHYTPFASISEACRDNCVVLNSPSKSFNIAGLQIANIICPDAALRRRINRAININEVCDVNPFGVIALQAAYNEGEEWLDELNQYLYENYQAVKEFFNTELPQVRVTRLEGTYLVWLDILPFELSSDEAYEKLMNDGKVFVNSGTMYGRKAGQGYLRLNIACPRKTLMQGLIRIARVLSQYMDEEDLSGCPA